jgi:hypothetical protein
MYRLFIEIKKYVSCVSICLYCVQTQKTTKHTKIVQCFLRGSGTHSLLLGEAENAPWLHIKRIKRFDIVSYCNIIIKQQVRYINTPFIMCKFMYKHLKNI